MNSFTTLWLVWLVYSCYSHLEHKAPVKRFVLLQFLNLRHSIGLLGQVISPSQGRYLTQTENKHKQTSMPRVGFEPTIPVFERAKTVHALDRAATVIGLQLCSSLNMTRTENFERWNLRIFIYMSFSGNLLQKVLSPINYFRCIDYFGNLSLSVCRPLSGRSVEWTLIPPPTMQIKKNKKWKEINLFQKIIHNHSFSRYLNEMNTVILNPCDE
jgi:hypothetical protein